MKNLIVAALCTASLALVSVSAFASDDKEEMGKKELLRILTLWR